MSDALANRVLRRQTAFEGERSPHEALWRECFDHGLPERSRLFWDIASATGANDSQAKRAVLVDSTATEASKTLASGLVGGMVPSNSQWFDMDTGQVDQVEENDWLSETSRFIWSAIHASNFDAFALEVFLDAIYAGWFVLYVEEAEEGGYSFDWWPVGQCWIAASKLGGDVDTVYRKFSRTIEQMASEYGIENCSPKVQEKFARGDDALSEKVEMIHVIEPRENFRDGSPFAKDMPFASLHVEANNKHICRESGYAEFPCAVPRWRLTPGSVYPYGPFVDVLPDVKTLNRLGMAEIQAAELAIMGMWKARDDGVLNPRSVRLGVRKIVAVADMENLQRLDTAAGRGAQQSWTVKQDLQRQIRTALLADYLQPQDKPQMTAYEVHVRVQMIRQLLGPHFGRFQSEFLQRLIKRCFGIAMRAGVLGEPPNGLDFYTVQYKSPLARAQQAEDAEATMAYMQYLTDLAANRQDPTVLDIVDNDKANRHIATGKGVPTDILREPDEILELRNLKAQQQAEQAQQEQQQQMQMMAAEGAAKQLAGA